MYSVVVNGKCFIGSYEDIKAIRETGIRKDYGCSGIRPFGNEPHSYSTKVRNLSTPTVSK